MAKSNPLWYRSRGLDDMESRFGNNQIQKFIKERLKSQKEIRVLELGFGEGRCLIELRARFPQKNIKLFGINDKKKGNMFSRKDFLKNAKRFHCKIDQTALPTPGLL